MKNCAVHDCYHLGKYLIDGKWFCTFHKKKIGKRDMSEVYE